MTYLAIQASPNTRRNWPTINKQCEYTCRVGLDVTQVCESPFNESRIKPQCVFRECIKVMRVKAYLQLYQWSIIGPTYNRQTQTLPNCKCVHTTQRMTQCNVRLACFFKREKVKRRCVQRECVRKGVILVKGSDSTIQR